MNPAFFLCFLFIMIWGLKPSLSKAEDNEENYYYYENGENEEQPFENDVEEDPPLDEKTIQASEEKAKSSKSTSQDQTSHEAYFEKKTFNEALFDLFQEFAFDLKTKAVPDADHVTIRRIMLSENIPRHYQDYIESLAQEVYKNQTPFRIVLCPECRIRKRVVKDGEVVLINPVNHSDVLDRIAENLGIEVWMDLSLVYQVNNLALSVKLYHQYTKELIWTKTYDSQTLYRAYLLEKRNEAVEDSNETRVQEEELSQMNIFVGLSGGIMPNVVENTSFISPQIGVRESFRSLPLSLLFSLSTRFNINDLRQDYARFTGNPETTLTVETQSTQDALLPLQIIINPNLLFAFHLRQKDFQEAKKSQYNPYVILGLGGLLGSGFLNLELNGGFAFDLRQKFLLTALLGYSPPSQIRFKDIYLYESSGGLSLALGAHFVF